MAAGPLRSRIHRILALDADPMLVSGKSLGIVMSGLLLAATLVVLNLPSSTRADEERAAKSISAADPTLVDVPYEVGATNFETGDEIKITEIRGTSENFKPKHEYWIKGTYTLRSRDRATLGASVTAQSSAGAIPQPHDPDQSLEIKRGSGEFTLKLPMHRNGWPHVSFYPADGGQSFGGVYFGTGDNVLKEWWKELPQSLDNGGEARIETEAVRQELKRQSDAKNQLKNLALALLNYNDAKGSLPANASYDSFDRPLLSWRVHILPHLDEEGAAELYKEFRLDEPWDSEHNRALIPRMPAVFQNPNRPAGPFTSYLAVVGSDCVFDGTPKGTSLSQIPDGTANTIMLVEADDAVEWTRPDDLKVNPQLPPVGLGGFRPNGWLAVFADGSVSLIGKDKSTREVRDFFTCGRKGTSATRPRLLAEAVNEFNMRAQKDDRGRHQPVLTEQEVLSAIENFDWEGARVESGIREIFRKIVDTRTLPAVAMLDFQTRSVDISEDAEDWLIILSVMTDPGTGYAIPVRAAHTEFTPTADDRPKAKFPSLEEQRQADIAWKRLGFELAPLPKKLKKNQSQDLIDYVRENGYDGGVLVTVEGSPRMEQNVLQPFDILVGLHAWPVTSMEDLAKILAREDLAELNPLKFYALRLSEVIDDGRELKFGPVTGRIYANLDDPLPRTTAPASEDYYAERSVSLTPQQMAEMITPQPAQPEPLAPDQKPHANQLQPFPRVVQATPQPIPLGAAESPVDVQPAESRLEQQSAADPTLEMLNHQLKQAQHQLHIGVPSGEDSETVKLKLHVVTLRKKIHERVKLLQQQAADANRGDPHPNPKTEASSVPTDVPPWMRELKAKLRDREPLNVVFFYVDHSESCQRTYDMLQQFQRKYINLPLNILSKDAEVERPLAVKYDIKRVPALLFIDGDDQLLKKTYGDITESQFAEYLLEAAEQLPAVSPTPPTLRYDGRTFEEWRTAWQTELSLEKRLEVVKALAAFGASGRGKEAAEAILDVANQLDWSYIHDAAKGRLQQACIDAFTNGEATDGYRIPSDAWFPLIVPIVEKSGDKFTFASYLVNQLSLGEKNLIPRLIELTKNSNTRNWGIQALKAVDPKLEDERVLKCFRDALGQKGQTAADVQMLIVYLSYPQNPGGGRDQNITLRFVPELEPFLFDPDEGTRRRARLAISWIQPADARELVKRLNARLDDESDKNRTEVIRALAAIGPQALPAESKLEQAATTTSDPDRYAAGVALERIRDNQDNASMNLGVDIQTTPFEPHRRQLDAERRELFPDGIYPPNDPMLGGGGGVF
jgi:thiol-disulfide isomerase/thioredoxin